MSHSDTDIIALQEQVRDQQALLAEILPVLNAHYEQMKARANRSAIHQPDPQKLEDLINRVAENMRE
jgi:hypothetical protein